LKAKYVIFFTTSVLVILLDQGTKTYITETMSMYESFTVVKGLFNITYVRNPGAAFGFLAGAAPGFRYVFFLTVTAIAIGLILYYIQKSAAKSRLLVFSLSLILAGAVGNLIDRIRFEEVIDFLDVYIGSHHWPAFNIADSAISIGAVVLIIEMVMKRDKSSSL